MDCPWFRETPPFNTSIPLALGDDIMKRLAIQVATKVLTKEFIGALKILVTVARA
jgi:hypothetical protein